MANLSAAFVELVRRAREGKGSSFYRMCEGCGQRTLYVLTWETSTQEGYTCSSCGFNKSWKVR